MEGMTTKKLLSNYTHAYIYICMQWFSWALLCHCATSKISAGGKWNRINDSGILPIY